jgi:hypothetical protein
MRPAGHNVETEEKARIATDLTPTLPKTDADPGLIGAFVLGKGRYTIG